MTTLIEPESKPREIWSVQEVIEEIPRTNSDQKKELLSFLGFLYAAPILFLLTALCAVIPGSLMSNLG